jgi:hypothetical protein
VKLRRLLCGHPGPAVLAVPGAQLTLYAAEVNVVRPPPPVAPHLLQPPLTHLDQCALADLAKQEERRPEQSVEVTLTSEPGPTTPSTPSASREITFDRARLLIPKAHCG